MISTGSKNWQEEEKKKLYNNYAPKTVPAWGAKVVGGGLAGGLPTSGGTGGTYTGKPPTRTEGPTIGYSYGTNTENKEEVKVESTPTEEKTPTLYDQQRELMEKNYLNSSDRITKTYDEYMKNLGSTYNRGVDSLESYNRNAQQNASVQYDRLKKYLPTQIKAQGLGGLGVSESAMLQANNQYVQQMGSLAENHQEQTANLLQNYMTNKTEAERAKNDSLSELEQAYNSGMLDIAEREDTALKAEDSKKQATWENVFNIISNPNSGYTEETLVSYMQNTGIFSAEEIEKAKTDFTNARYAENGVQIGTDGKYYYNNGGVSYSVDNTLSVEGKYSSVKDGYIKYANEHGYAAAFSAFAQDENAKKYLGDTYATMYDYLQNFAKVSDGSLDTASLQAELEGLTGAKDATAQARKAEIEEYKKAWTNTYTVKAMDGYFAGVGTEGVELLDTILNSPWTSEEVKDAAKKDFAKQCSSEGKYIAIGEKGVLGTYENGNAIGTSFGNFNGVDDANSGQKKYENAVIEAVKNGEIKEGQLVKMNYGKTDKDAGLYRYLGDGIFEYVPESTEGKGKDAFYAPNGYKLDEYGDGWKVVSK